MPRTRPYTRKELETLRRADLQNLYKIHGLKGANQKSDALIDALEAYFISKPAPSSPMKATRPVPGAMTGGMARHLKPIEGQGRAGVPVQRGPVSRPVTRKSPVKGVGAGLSMDSSRVREGEPGAVVDKAVEKPGRPNPPRPTLPPLTSTNDSLLRRVTTLTSKIENLESTLSASRLDTLTSDITLLREEVSRLDKEVIALRENAAEREKEWEKRLEEVEQGWKGRLQVTESVWEERFKVLETKISGSRVPAEISRSGSAGTAVQRQSSSPSSIALGKRRERSPNPSDPPGFPSDPASSPKRARATETSPTRADLIALARRSASPRTPSPTKTPSDGVFKTPDLPASVIKGRLSQQPFPRTPSPGHQGTLPDNSATPSSVSDSNYFAGLPPMDSTRGRKKKREDEEPLPFPLFATTPRPSAPLSPTTDAPPSTIRRARQGSIVQGDMVLTPGRRPTRTVSHAHMELSSAMDSRSTSLETPSNISSRTETVPIQGSRIVFPDRDPIPSTSLTDILGPELTRETSVPRGLSPSPSITETRFSTLPFPTSAKSSRSVSNTTTLATATTAADLELRSPPSKGYMQSISKPLKQVQAGIDTPEAQSTPTMQTTPTMGSTAGLGLGLGMTTPGHRTMLGTERYRDTRFGDSEVMMGWGTPEMGLETPRGGDRT